METLDDISIEVVYAQPEKQVIIPLTINSGTNIKAAIIQSGILELFPEINLDENKVGIFGKITAMDNLLREGDRIEIYRPLIADPKEIRRQRALEGKKMKKGGATK